jgi:hypothetical protein
MLRTTPGAAHVCARRRLRKERVGDKEGEGKVCDKEGEPRLRCPLPATPLVTKSVQHTRGHRQRQSLYLSAISRGRCGQRADRPLSNTTARLHDCTTARLHDCTTARLHDCTTARLQPGNDITPATIVTVKPLSTYHRCVSRRLELCAVISIPG